MRPSENHVQYVEKVLGTMTCLYSSICIYNVRTQGPKAVAISISHDFSGSL